MPEFSDVTIALNYYAPYVSGLTNVARDVAEGLARLGRKVTVVASQHDPVLPLEEIINGVRVLRTPIFCRVGKGVLSPSFISTVVRESLCSRVLNLHTPMLEAGPIALLSKAPVVLTYQCDVSLPPTMLGRVQNKILDLSTILAARKSRFVTVSSDDYADHSRVRSALSDRRIVIPPTCHSRGVGFPSFRDGEGMHIGFLGRIVEEKGIEYLVDGFRALDDNRARLLIAGDFANVAGGSVIDKVRKAIGEDSRIRLLGFLPDRDIDDFYASIDVFALPSVNPFEAFGIVQVEAMMKGIPVIASDLPGVRQPVLVTGMGEIVKPGSSASITSALNSIKNIRVNRTEGAAYARSLYGFGVTLKKFDDLFKSVSTGRV